MDLGQHTQHAKLQSDKDRKRPAKVFALCSPPPRNKAGCQIPANRSSGAFMTLASSQGPPPITARIRLHEDFPSDFSCEQRFRFPYFFTAVVGTAVVGAAVWVLQWWVLTCKSTTIIVNLIIFILTFIITTTYMPSPSPSPSLSS